MLLVRVFLAGGSVRTVARTCLEFKILSAKQLGCDNLLNNARATMCALEALKTAK